MSKFILINQKEQEGIDENNLLCLYFCYTKYSHLIHIRLNLCFYKQVTYINKNKFGCLNLLCY